LLALICHRGEIRMIGNLNRVFSIDHGELKAATTKLLKFAVEGETSEFEPGIYSEKIPEMAGIYFLVITQAITIKDDIFFRLDKLKKNFLEVWQKIEPESQDNKYKKSEARVNLKNQLQAILTCRASSENIKKEALLKIKTIKEEDNIKFFFDELINRLQAHHQESRHNQTVLDLRRDYYLDNKPIRNLMGQDITLQDFGQKLQKENLNTDLIEFLLEYYNQKGLGSAGAGMQEIFADLMLVLTDKGYASIANNKQQFTNIDVINESEILVISQCNYTTFQKEELPRFPSDCKASSFFQLRVKVVGPKKNNIPYSNIEITLEEGYFDIYDPEFRKEYINLQSEKAVKKIRVNQYVNSNDKRVIDLLLYPYRSTTGEFKLEEFVRADAKTLFLALWNKSLDAQKLLLAFSEKRVEPITFFKRPVEIVQSDLILISKKHACNPDPWVQDQFSQYSDFLAYLRPTDYEKIKQALNDPAKCNKMLSCLYTLTDIPTIKTLLKDKGIKYRLDGSVLTHFAVQDKTIANSLLRPTLWERFKFRVRAFLGKARDQRMPYTQFESSHLKQIICAFPSFWASHFKKPSILSRLFGFPNYRSKLKRQELRELIDLKYKHEPWHTAAVDEIWNDPELRQEIGGIPPNQAIVYRQENPNITFERFRDPLYQNDWQILHNNLTDIEVEEFYQKKLELEYAKSKTEFFKAVIDIWCSISADPANNRLLRTSQQTAWRAVPLNKINIAKKAVIASLVNKTLHITESNFRPVPNLGLPGSILIAEIFFTNPLQNAYPENAFPQQTLQEFQTALLGNSEIFTSLFEPPRLLGDKTDILASQIIRKLSDFTALFDNQNFLNLIKLTPRFYENIFAIFNHVSISKICENFFKLKSLKEKILHLRHFTQNCLARTEIESLYNNPDFLTKLEKFPLLQDNFEHLQATLRFKGVVKTNLFLFNECWQILKNGSDTNEKLLELLNLMSDENLADWLDKNPKEIDFLIDKFIYDSNFYLLFVKSNTKINLINAALCDRLHRLMDKKTESVNRLARNNLILLLLHCHDFGNYYFNEVRIAEQWTITRVKFKSILREVGRYDEYLMFIKYGKIFLNTLLKVECSEENIAATLDGCKESNLLIDVSQYDDINFITYITKKVNELKGMLCKKNKTSEIIQHILPDSNLIANLKCELNSVAELVKHGGAGVHQTSLSDLSNLFLIKAILDPTFSEIIFKENLASELIQAYANRELLVRFITVRSINLEPFFDKLTKLIDDPCFVSSIPQIKKYPNFSKWLFRQEIEFINKLIDEKYLTEQDLIAFLKDCHLESGNIMNFILKELKTNKEENEKGLSFFAILEKSSELRFNLLRNARNTNEIRIDFRTIIGIVNHLLKLGLYNCNLINEIIKPPYIHYLLEEAEPENIFELIKILIEFERENMKTVKQQCNYILSKVTTLFYTKRDFYSKMVYSEGLLSICYRYAIQDEPNKARAMILFALSLSRMPDSVTTFINNILEPGFVNLDLYTLFTDSVDENDLALFYTLLHKKSIPKNLEIIRQRMNQSPEILERITRNDLKPEIQKRLFVVLLTLGSKEECNAILAHLQNLSRTMFNEDRYQRILNRIPGNDLVDLYIADGIPVIFESAITFETLANKTLKPITSYFFRPHYNGIILNRVFLEADDNALRKFFEYGPNYPKYLINYCEQANTNTELAIALRNRLVSSQKNDGELLKFFISKLGQGEYCNALIAMIDKDQALVDSFVATMLTLIDPLQRLLLLSNREVENILLPYLEKKPEYFKDYLSEDLCGEFINYLLKSPKSHHIYLLIQNTKCLSELFEKVINWLQLEPQETMLNRLAILMNASGVDLAQIFNYEYTQRKSSILSKEILKHKMLLNKMLSALHHIDASIVLNDDLRTALENFTHQKDSHNILIFNTYLNNFEETRPLRFKTLPDTPLTEDQILGYFLALKCKLEYDIEFLQKSVDKARFTTEAYLAFLDKVKNLVGFIDEAGRFVFHQTGNPIPSEYAYFYYEGLARFFYVRKEPIMRLLAKKEFCNSLIQTLKFIKDGTAFIKRKSSDSLKASDNYCHFVLSAYCQNSNIMDQVDNSPYLANAFLKYITIINGEICFSQVDDEEDRKLPQRFAEVVKKCLSAKLLDDLEFRNEFIRYVTENKEGIAKLLLLLVQDETSMLKLLSNDDFRMLFKRQMIRIEPPGTVFFQDPLFQDEIPLPIYRFFFTAYGMDGEKDYHELVQKFPNLRIVAFNQIKVARLVMESKTSVHKPPTHKGSGKRSPKHTSWGPSCFWQTSEEPLNIFGEDEKYFNLNSSLKCSYLFPLPHK
jgi:SOS response regulatory protein OraA/RecX